MKTKSITLILMLILGTMVSFYSCNDDDLLESRENDIDTFIFLEATGAADIDNALHNIEVEVRSGTDLSKLIPAFEVSRGATAVPPSGTESDYSRTFTIIVFAEDGSPQDWEVDVTEADPPASIPKNILTFSFPDDETGEADIDQLAHTVKIEVAKDTDLKKLTPTFTISPETTSDPESGTESDYSSKFIITVTAADDSTQDWEIDVTEADTVESEENDILTFSFDEQTEVADINNDLHNIKIEVANGIDLTSLTPTYTISEGATANPASITDGNFSDALTIKVTAENGDVQDWKIFVTEAESDPSGSSENDILTFSLGKQTGDAVINSDTHTIDVEVRSGSDLTNLGPE